MSTRTRIPQPQTANQSLTQWTHQQLIARFGGARLSLRVTVEESRHLRAIRERERIGDEGKRLAEVYRDLIAERAALVDGTESRVLQTLALRVANYYQQLGVLENAAERILGRHAGEEEMKQMGL
jgi:hypothetical protein